MADRQDQMKERVAKTKKMVKAAIDLGKDPLLYAKRFDNARGIVAKAKQKPQSKRRPGQAPNTIAGRTARTAPVKKAGGGSSTVKPRKKSTGSSGSLAGRSPAMSPKKKSAQSRGAADRAKSDARKTRSADVDRRRRSRDASKAGKRKALQKKYDIKQGYKRDAARSRMRGGPRLPETR